jgi:transaldolase
MSSKSKNPLYQLLDQGQSVWLDSIQRGQIKSGELKQLTQTVALRGETANPSIFEKAITGSSDYDSDIQALAGQGKDANATYEKLATDDVRAACDVFRPIYEESDGADGFVSIEVSPRLAFDTDGTIKEAKRFWETVSRPNLLVKIPGTKEGVPAIEESLYQGVNINITLLFALEAYDAVALAFIRALERRVAEGKSITHLSSVASFFVSRIDTLADKWLQDATKTESDPQRSKELKDLPGKIAIANAQIAYEHFMRTFSGSRWESLQSKGARVQRPLWASTSTKNPAYRDVMYVETLIGPNTINTLPLETIKAFADHGVVARTVDSDIAGAHDVVRRFEAAGFSLSAVTDRVLKEGVEKFDEAFAKLLKGIEQKREQFQTAERKAGTILL